MTQSASSARFQPRWWHIAGAAAALVVVAVLVAALLVRPRLNEWARERTVAALAEHFDSEVELGSMQVTAGLLFRARGENLVLRHKGRRDVPPLITVASFDASTSLWRVLRSPRHIRHVRVDGLAINIPPRYSQDEERFPGATPPSKRPARPPVPTDRPKPAPGNAPRRERAPSPVLIGTLAARDTRLTVVPREADKTPYVIEIHTLDMEDLAPDRRMPFQAVLDNAVPAGRIDTTGTFGPWATDEPGLTPLDGRFVFADADLDTIPGLRGVLQARGTFDGVLNRIEVGGSTATSDFQLETAGQPVTMETVFSSVVDATNGNTWLDPVEARLAEATHIIATGGVVKARQDDDGRTVDLDVLIEGGRLEEILRLVMERADTPMIGGIDLKAKLLIPPGDVPVIRKMRLDGTFALHRAAFTIAAVQQKVDELSQRAQGRPDDDAVADVLSDFSGRFSMRNGTITFPSLNFTTQGARVQLAGHYSAAGDLDFEGTIRMSADVSQMVTGRKSFFLRAIDPLMRSRGATQFPIHIRGTLDEPDFGVSVGKTLRQMVTPGK